MYKLNVAIVFWLFAVHMMVSAQSKEPLTQTVRGIVTDKASGEPLVSAVVQIEGMESTSITNDKGIFTMQNVPLGRHTLSVSGMGYETAVMKEILVGSAREVYLEIGLAQKPVELDEIVIRPTVNKAGSQNNMALTGARMFSVEEASRYAGGMDDPARLATTYAGVASTGISNNGISVRGNAPALLQWRLEEVEIPNPNHFADLDVLGGGFLSALSSNVLGNSDFLMSAFPAEYNNAVSGVFDMRLRNGNNQRYQHTFQLGMLGIDLASEGPISRKRQSSYLINYRYSTTKLLEDLRGSKGMGGTLGYQDLNFKLHFPTKKTGTFSVWGTGLADKVVPIAEDADKWNYREDAYLAGARQRSAAAGVSHRYLFGNNKTALNTTMAATHLGNSVYESIYEQDDRYTPRTDMATRTTNLVFTSAVNHKFSARHTNRTGVTFTNIRYNMRLDHTPIPGDPLQNISDATDNTHLVSAYSSSRIQLRRNLLLSLGVNAQYFGLNRQATIEPRTSIRWKATPRSSLSLAYGLHSRIEKPDVYFVKDMNGRQSNENLQLARSHHFMLGYMYRISPDMTLRIEPYYQHLFDIPVTPGGAFSILNRTGFYFTDILVSEGKGRNYGVDISFERYLKKGLYYMINASLFDSEYQAGNGQWYDTRYNRRFTINGMVGKEWMIGRDMLGINLKLSLLGGKRYTPVDEAATLAHPDKVVQYDESRMFSRQFSPMYIGDFSISYKMNRKRMVQEFAIKSVNATGQKEYVEHRYNIKTQTIEPYRPANSLFNLSYRIEF